MDRDTAQLVDSCLTYLLLTKRFCWLLAGVISSLQEQASNAEPVPVVRVDWAACLPQDSSILPTQPIDIHYHDPEEEIALGECTPC